MGGECSAHEKLRMRAKFWYACPGEEDDDSTNSVFFSDGLYATSI
jgi:hypothetical protein